jgi:hypothetical protein
VTPSGFQPIIKTLIQPAFETNLIKILPLCSLVYIDIKFTEFKSYRRSEKEIIQKFIGWIIEFEDQESL